ncbi:transposase [Patescibacteria group bacterium]|nr:transposase [Patescibacteria group bacterium]
MYKYKNKTKRIYLKHCYYFVTVKTFKNKRIFQNEIYAKIFLNTLLFLKQRGDFELSACVLLHNHFHLLLIPKKKNISEIMHDLKSYSAQKINNHRRSITTNQRRGILASPSHNNHKGEAGSLTSEVDENLKHVWQRSFYYHVIENDNENDFENHYEYIYNNPIKHGYVDNPNNWPYLIVDTKYHI